MKSIKLLAAGLAALVLFAGTAAAMPGNAPVDTGADNAENEAADAGPQGNSSNAPVNGSDAASDARENGAQADGNQGPPANLPGQVPDHVSQIHDLVRQFIGGDLDGSLGDAISDVTPGDDADADEDSESEDADADEDSESEDEESEDDMSEDADGDAESADDNANATAA